MTTASTSAFGVPHLAGKARSRGGRMATERGFRSLLFVCGLFTILITFAIIFVLITQSIGFFRLEDVRLLDFLFGLNWEPKLGAEQHFGIWPLVCGTVVVAGVSAIFALPCGTITAIYLSEYAPRRVRAVLKPVLEILAGIPTVVYGFFALTIITPWLQQFVPGLGTFNALSAGIAVGIMVLPIVCSLSEDALQAVPRSLREGAYAVGATKFEVSARVVTPAALSGIMASYLLAISRAIGETMIVALAAGGIARLTLDPRADMQTMTAYMVQVFLGDTAAGGVEYYSAYAVALVLFVMTFLLAIVGNRVLARFREVYD